MLGQSLKGNTYVGSYSQVPHQKGFHTRWHAVSVALPANVAVATLLEQAEFLCRVA